MDPLAPDGPILACSQGRRPYSVCCQPFWDGRALLPGHVIRCILAFLPRSVHTLLHVHRNNTAHSPSDLQVKQEGHAAKTRAPLFAVYMYMYTSPVPARRTTYSRAPIAPIAPIVCDSRFAACVLALRAPPYSPLTGAPSPPLGNATQEYIRRYLISRSLLPLSSRRTFAWERSVREPESCVFCFFSSVFVTNCYPFCFTPCHRWDVRLQVRADPRPRFPSPPVLMRSADVD